MGLVGNTSPPLFSIFHHALQELARDLLYFRGENNHGKGSFMKIKELAFQALQVEAENLIKIVHDVFNSVATDEVEVPGEEECPTDDITQTKFHFHREIWETKIAPLIGNPVFHERVSRFLGNASPTIAVIRKNGAWDISTQLFLVRFQMIKTALTEKEWACLDCFGSDSALLTSFHPRDMSRPDDPRRPERD